MKTYLVKPTYDRLTGELDGGTLKTQQGIICDHCGVELSYDHDSDNFPYVGLEIKDMFDSEPYYYEERLRYNREETKQIFGLDYHEYEIDNYDIFPGNPYTYCREHDCFRTILQSALSDEEINIEQHMLKARMVMLDRVLRQKLFTPAELGISFK